MKEPWSKKNINSILKFSYYWLQKCWFFLDFWTLDCLSNYKWTFEWSKWINLKESLNSNTGAGSDQLSPPEPDRWVMMGNHRDTWVQGKAFDHSLLKTRRILLKETWATMYQFGFNTSLLSVLPTLKPHPRSTPQIPSSFPSFPILPRVA